MEPNNHDKDFVRSPSTAPAHDLQARTRIMARALTGSMKQVGSTVGDNPLLLAGAFAGIALAVAGGVYLGTRRRRTFLDRMMDLF